MAASIGPFDEGDNKRFSSEDSASTPSLPRSPAGDLTDDGYRLDDEGRRQRNQPQDRGEDGNEEERLMAEPKIDRPGYDAIPVGQPEQERVHDRNFIERCKRCQLPCTKLLFIVSAFFSIVAVIALVLLIIVYLEIRSKSHNITLASDQSPQNIFVMSNSTYKIDVNPLLFSGMRVRYNQSNNMENKHPPPSLALVRKSCINGLKPQHFEGRYNNTSQFTRFPFARHWPKGEPGTLNVTTYTGEVRVYYGQSQDEYMHEFQNCMPGLQKNTCESYDHCEDLQVNRSEDVYIVLCSFQYNTSFYYQLKEKQYNVSAGETILEPGDTAGIYVLFNSLVSEMFHPGMCTYLVTMDSDSDIDLQYTTPVIVEALFPRWEEYSLLFGCIVLPLVVLAASFVACCCCLYCRKNDVCPCA